MEGLVCQGSEAPCPLCAQKHQAGSRFRGQEERRAGRSALENESLKTTRLWGSSTNTRTPGEELKQGHVSPAGGDTLRKEADQGGDIPELGHAAVLATLAWLWFGPGPC